MSVVRLLEPDQTSDWFSEQLSLLTRLRSVHSLSNLDPVLAKAITGGLPFGLSGFADFRRDEDLTTIVRRAEACWASRSAVLDESIDLGPLFSISRESFNGHVSSIFEGLIYRSSVARGLFWDWLKGKSELWSSQHICRPLHAYLDTFDGDQPKDLSEDDEDVLANVCSTVLRRAFEDASRDQDSSSISCGRLFLQHSRLKKNSFAETIRKMVDSLNVNSLHESVVRFGASLNKHISAEFPSLSESIAKHLLSSAVRHLSDITTVGSDDDHQLQLICGYHNVHLLPSAR